MGNDSQTIILNEAWSHRLIQKNNSFFFEIYIQSGFCGWNKEFEVNYHYAQIIQTNRRRRYFLVSVFHPIFQNQTDIIQRGINNICELLLLGNTDKISDFLNKFDNELNGAVSNILRICYRLPERCIFTFHNNWFAEEKDFIHLIKSKI